MLQKEENDGVYIFKVTAPRVDWINAADLRKQFKGYLEDQPEDVLIDLTETDYFDSSAIGLLLALKKQVKEYGGMLTLDSPPESLKELLAVCNLTDFFEIINER